MNDSQAVSGLEWGGLADTVKQDCVDPDNLDTKTVDLLQRLAELANCSGLNEVAQFLNSPRGFSVLERNYLMSPLLDQIYACLTLPLRAKKFEAPDFSNAAPVMPLEEGVADDATDRIPVRPDRTGLAVLVACMKGFADVLEFILCRERHLTSNLSCEQLLALLDGISAEDAGMWIVYSPRGHITIQPLAIASYWGHVSCVECLLRHGADVHGDQDCALRCAADQGHDLVVDLLLRAGADVHARSNTARRAAIQKGHVATVKRLLQADPDVAFNQQNAVFLAAGNPSVEVLRCVLEALGDVPLDSSALFDAIRSGSPDHLQHLLNRGADPNMGDGQPLIQLVTSQHLSAAVLKCMVGKLINAGANVNAGNDQALRLAIKGGSAAAVKALLDNGACLKTVLDDPENTIAALGRRSFFGWNIGKIEVLWDAGMPVDGTAASEILAKASLHNCLDVIDLFEARGASPVSINSARLIAAVGQGDLDLVLQLLKRQLDPVVLHGRALHAAVKCGHQSVLAALLEHGQRVGPAPAEAIEFRRYCLVRAAVDFESMDMFCLLVERMAVNASQLIDVLDILLTASEVPEAAVRLLLDRFAGTLLSVDELTGLSHRLPGDGAGRDVLRPYLVRQ